MREIPVRISGRIQPAREKPETKCIQHTRTYTIKLGIKVQGTAEFDTGCEKKEGELVEQYQIVTK